MKLSWKLLLPALLCSAISVYAKPKLPYLFTDNMVLQQQSNPAIWGWASAGKTITVATSWDGKRYTTEAAGDGKWKLNINTIAAGGPFIVTVSDGETVTLNNVWLGEVWLCGGQSNMEMPVKGYRDQPVLGSMDAILHSKGKKINMITIPRAATYNVQDTNKVTMWKSASPEAVANFSATGWFFGNLLNQLLDVPIGLISCNYGGSNAEAWMTSESLKAFPEIAMPEQGKQYPAPNRVATMLYNGMLAPVVGYGIKGAIWYQGESNMDRPEQYLSLFPAMVKDWRQRWGQGDFPFYYVQIAPYNYSVPYREGAAASSANSAYLREAQLKAQDKIPNSGMAVIMDGAEENIIHPAHKKEAGERLALWALAKTYNIDGFAYESPAPDSLIFNGNTITIRFKNNRTGLTSYSKPLTNFQIAGKDKKFWNANANIVGGRIVVSSPRVPEPVAVRYAFKDFVVGELFSVDGLPVSSFRTDDWTDGVYME